MEKQIQEITHAEPISVEVQRAKDGTYYWTIKSHAKTVEEALADIVNMDERLRFRFIPPAKPEEAAK